MTRDQAKAWFEAAAATGVWPATGATEALGHAVEALSQQPHPKFVSLREGDVAILEFEHRVSKDAVERIRETWKDLVGTRVVVIEGGGHLVGKREASGPSYEVPAVPL
jgi:hypothetical protein